MARASEKGGRGSSAAEDPTARALGRAITVLRTERGLGRRRLSEEADLSYSYLAEIENGKKKPSAEAQKAIADALGLSVDDLLSAAEALLTQLGELEPAPAMMREEPVPYSRVSPARAALVSRQRDAALHHVRDAPLEGGQGEPNLEAQPALRSVVRQWVDALAERLFGVTERVERDMERVREDVESYRKRVEELRVREERASVERDELGNRLSRSQDRVLELNRELARLTERQDQLTVQLEKLETGTDASGEEDS